VHVYILDQARAAAAVAAGHLPAPDRATAAAEAAGETSTQGVDGSRNAQSALSFMKGFLPKYFSSEWSFAQFRLPEDTPKVRQAHKRSQTPQVFSRLSFVVCSNFRQSDESRGVFCHSPVPPAQWTDREELPSSPLRLLETESISQRTHGRCVWASDLHVWQVIVAFGAKRNSLVIVGTNGTFYKCSFDAVKGGDCKQDSYCMFIREKASN
jgi:hypothetical protein